MYLVLTITLWSKHLYYLISQEGNYVLYPGWEPGSPKKKKPTKKQILTNHLKKKSSV